ncbi:hypothetical protein BCT30_13670 [Enterovibrio norvegicus]|uniref:hypothetical protein n=1 Tax=Enterovibrio norvegicus TaxID=188144 RepID=UPI000C816325|nr:hypothetical protein [Enterovibrio norvegicus]PMN52175.1 hypothetical protein BCT30_13670 [Enterovibrio norvegicus]TKF29263.1 hypothetical protein FCV83_22275 [Enterovibrio norvegicus]
MKNTHDIHVFAPSHQLLVNKEISVAQVYWSVTFNRELDSYFNKRSYTHDFKQLKEGVGHLEIQFRYDDSLTIEDNLSYVEVLAAKHLVSNSGINAFGFTNDKVTIRRDHINIVFSQETAITLLIRKNVEKSTLSRLGSISAKSSPAAGYLYGATAELETNFDWIIPRLTQNASFDFFSSDTDLNIREDDYIFTPLGDFIIDYRSVEELMESEWVRFQIEVRKQDYARPFELLADLVRASDQTIREGNPYLVKIKKLFGEDSILLLNTSEKTWLPAKLLLDDGRETYLIMGHRRYLKPEILAEMHEHGFAQHIKKIALESD